MIKQVIFDLGRVLLEWEPEQLAQKLAEEDADFEIEVWKITTHANWHQFDLGNLRIADLLDLHSHQYPRNTLQQFLEKAPHILTPLHEGMKLLEAAKQKKLKLYILSNMSHDFTQHLVDTYPFLHEFDGSIYSCHYNLAKPDPKIFKTLLKQFHLKPEESLFVDDIPANIETAKQLGLETVLFTKEEKTYKEFLEKINATK